jgi:hypothetical protein
MFLSNLFLAVSSFNPKDITQIHKQSSILRELKQEHAKLFPNRRYETLISYFVPFTAFFRVAYRYFEMFMFFRTNKDTQMFDYMVYTYTKDINKIKKD